MATTDRILVRYGDLLLKKRNKKRFIDTALARIEEKLTSEKAVLETNHDRLYIKLNGEDPDRVLADLDKVAGLRSYSLVRKSRRDLDAIKAAAVELLTEEIKRPTRFKVETKRADKRYPMTSIEVSQEVAKHVLPVFEELTADVRNPELILDVEIRDDAAYLFADKIPGLGGFPVGSMGKGVAMLSGGIDSAVAAFLAMRKGLDLELLHFESTPLTPIEAAQKVYDIAARLSIYAKDNRSRLYYFPFTELHQAILKNIPEPYHITIMRRMMMRIACAHAKRRNYPVVVNGESVGQVASQTLWSLFVSDAVATRSVLRPLSAADKNEIIDWARSIGTYSIAIRPYEDCCQVYVPKHPETKPRDYLARRYEEVIDYETLIKKGLAAMQCVEVDETSKLDFASRGFTVEEALKEEDGDD